MRGCQHESVDGVQGAGRRRVSAQAGGACPPTGNRVDGRRSRRLARRPLWPADPTLARPYHRLPADRGAAALQWSVSPPLLPDARATACRACGPTCCTWTKNRTTWRPGSPCALPSDRALPAFSSPGRISNVIIPGLSGISSRPITGAPVTRSPATRPRRRVLREKGYGGPVSVIPQFGVDPQLFSPAPVRATGQRPNLVIGYAGRLVPEKGVDLLLRACAGLRGVAWSLRLLGDGPARQATCPAGRRAWHFGARVSSSALCLLLKPCSTTGRWTCWCCRR